MPQVAPIAERKSLQARLRSQAAEAFSGDGRVLNLLEGDWKEPDSGRHYESPIDGSSLGPLPMIELDTAIKAVQVAKILCQKRGQGGVCGGARGVAPTL